MSATVSDHIGIPFCDQCGHRASPESGITLCTVVEKWQAVSLCDKCLNANANG